MRNTDVERGKELACILIVAVTCLLLWLCGAL